MKHFYTKLVIPLDKRFWYRRPNIILVSLLSTLIEFHIFFYCFYSWIWAGKCPLWYHRRHICVRKNILHLILPCEQGRNFFMFSGHYTIHLIEFDFLKSASCTVLGKFPPWKIPTQKILTHQTLPWKVLPTPDNYHPENSHVEYSDPFH